MLIALVMLPLWAYLLHLAFHNILLRPGNVMRPGILFSAAILSSLTFVGCLVVWGKIKQYRRKK
jgi:hypothetical protein